ncbi:hypothetical protein E4U42_005753 [Claviceps africana]|uniref:Uncharacterized protein n=1 Tax=Claviceps africana TaxID=83212 RepID=A0A8K0NNX8_9HYPO|nr:hypothetical protein E4U42_005753 [Claviceps africana]
MAVFSSVRRNLVVAACLSLLLLAGFLNARDSFDMERFESINPFQANKTAQNAFPSYSNSGKKRSRLHFLIPASNSNLNFCYHLASAAANRYPVPTLIGWNGEGEMNIAQTHLAKLRAVKRYLDSLDVAEADDLILMADGYDIIHQLPPEVVIERYFELVREANEYLAQRMGLSVKEMKKKGTHQTIFFGPDKVCFPDDDENAARCWAAPASLLGPDPFGPSTDDVASKDPRWLNSGTIIGPVSDLSKVIDASIHEINVTYSQDYWQRDSDQYYLANLFGRQEYWRNRMFLQQVDTDEKHIIPEKESDTQETEFHMAIEYESSLFQTKNGNEMFTGHLQYNLADQTANVNIDLFEKGESFRPYPIKMPDNVRDALLKLFDSVPDAHPEVSGEEWIRLAHLGTNFVTKHIYGLWHCTGAKESLDFDYAKMWFYPFVKSLLRETAKAWQGQDPISTKLIDGRIWFPKRSYHETGVVNDEYGGGWSDESPHKFVTWREMCGHHEDMLFWGQQATGL